jgi:DNA-binding response OmpR family regulator
MVVRLEDARNPGRNRSRVTGSAKIVLVEDEAFQREVIAECLAQHGLRPTALSSGAELKRLAQYSMPDIALLDVHLNESEDGFALARWLRSRSARIGILMLTVAGDTIDRVVGLESGADDYVVKPFEARELVARVKALLRRTGRTPQPPRLSEVRIGMAMLDLQRRLLVLADGAEAKLSASEFEWV